jgi:hypothetical protein
MQITRSSSYLQKKAISFPFRHYDQANELKFRKKDNETTARHKYANIVEVVILTQSLGSHMNLERPPAMQAAVKRRAPVI